MVLFPNFFSNFPNSFHARFSILSGLLSPKEYVSYLNPRIGIPTLFEVLHGEGYVNAMYDSCSRHYVREMDFLAGRKLDIFHDSESMPGRERFPTVAWGVLETATLEAMRVQLGRFAADRSRFCLAYFPVAPHMPFDTILPEFNRFEPGTPSLDGNYTGRYKNQLLYMDWILASLIEELERLGLLDQTLVVITNDHGEMVGEDGDRLGHGWRLDPILCNNPLIIMDPRQPGYRLNYTFGSHIDVLPTILDLINVPPPPALY
jgi:phosphoglycerol transferase MdoB-like AlkP superfamily enzyme